MDTDIPSPLLNLGWSPFFHDQLTPEDIAFEPMRIARVHRTRMAAISQSGPVKLTLPQHTNTGDYAVGDWVIVNPTKRLLQRRLERKSLLKRHTEGANFPQLIASNIDTLFIVTSCNADFSPARLERYLALVNEAGIQPVIVLTKADMTDDAASYAEEAKTLQRDLDVVFVNSKSSEAVDILAPWCTPGSTVALIGSSGVGKSTLLNTLAGPEQAIPQETGGIRESDAKGRHTTTSRSLHEISGHAWVIDTPGMRTLHLSDVADGIDTLFAEITELAPSCKFRDCSHSNEPGCAIQAAIKAGELDAERLDRWRKLSAESIDNTSVAATDRAGQYAKKMRKKNR